MNQIKASKFLELATVQANLFSKDPNTKVGCIIIAPETYHILSCGYNGMPRGIDETIMSRWERPTKYHYIQHAETNAICHAARHGVALNHGICVVSLFPCSECAKSIIQCGIKVVVTRPPDSTNQKWAEDWTLSRTMLEEAHVTIMEMTHQNVR